MGAGNSQRFQRCMPAPIARACTAARLLDGREGYVVLGGDHPGQYPFEGHRMAANVPAIEEVATTRPLAVADRDFVVAVFTVEGDVEPDDLHTMPFARVHLGFFDFADQAGLHGQEPSLGCGGEPCPPGHALSTNGGASQHRRHVMM